MTAPKGEAGGAAKRWAATKFVKVSEAGRTKPLILGCRNGVGPKAETREFFTKALGCPEITRESLFAELFGTLLARELGLHVAEPAVIEMGAAFVNLANEQEGIARAGIKLRQSMAFGATLVPGLIQTGELTPETDDEFADAAAIFAFDLLVQNPDRNATRQNVARSKGRLLAYDFELSFSFTRALAGGNEPHEVGRIGIHERHCFYKVLRGRPALLETFLAAFGQVSEGRIRALAESAPEEWCTYRCRIVDHLINARRHSDEFGTELRRLLT